ncbi:MAG: hypothetical protein AAF585_13270 [Verrucomicrobiota bacterium]
MQIRHVLFFTSLFAISAIGQEADAPAITTGPPEGTDVTPVMAYAPVGPRAGEEFDAAAAIGNRPGALLFIHELTRNGLPVIRGLDQIGAEFSLLGFRSHTLQLSDDRTEAETKLKAVNGSLKLQSPIVLSIEGGLDGPGNYALNRKAVLSLIMLKDGKVHKSVAFTDVNAEDQKLVRELIVEVSGELPTDAEELAALMPEDSTVLRILAAEQMLEIRRLRGQLAKLKEAQYSNRMMGQRPAANQRPAARPAAAEPKRGADESEEMPVREGKPPEDPELNALLRAFIRQDNDKEKVDEVYADITKRAAENDEMMAQAIDMFKLMLSFRDRYGTQDAQALAEGFLKEHAK